MRRELLEILIWIGTYSVVYVTLKWLGAGEFLNGSMCAIAAINMCRLLPKF